MPNFEHCSLHPPALQAFSYCRRKYELTEAGPTTCLTLARMRRHPRETADLAMPTRLTGAPPSGFNPLSKLGTQFDLDRFRVWGVGAIPGRSRTNGSRHLAAMPAANAPARGASRHPPTTTPPKCRSPSIRFEL